MALGVSHDVLSSPWTVSAEIQDMCYSFYMLFNICIDINPVYGFVH